MAPPPPLSILLVAAPAPAGGLETVLLNLGSGLNRLGHSAAFAAVVEPGGGGHPVLEAAAGRGLPVHPVEVAPRAYFHEYGRIRETISALAPGVVHTHGYRADLIGGRAARRAGVPWVSTAHGFAGGDAKNRFYEWLQARALRRADRVIAVSRPLARRLELSGVAPRRITHLPNAWSPMPLLTREEARARLGLPRGTFTFGWVGRLSGEKGPDLFLEALARLPDDRWQASIVGEGPERSRLAAQAESLGIASRLRWHGMVPSAAGLYPAFDAWVLSSRTEGTPVALFEAMAARIPLVVTAVGGVPDVVSADEAVIVPPESPSELAAGMQSLRSDPQGARDRAEAAHRRLTAVYGSGEWLAAHVGLYREVVSGRGGRAA